jgi:CPA2 family monovalent cation:H+ antiporter-2
MPQNLSLITTLAAAFGFALFMGFIAARLKLPPLLGYLVAGILLGPATPGYIADIELSRQLAEVGVMLLMFGVGLHFSFEDLMAVRRIALPGALVQMTVATMLGAVAALLWGWNLGDGVVFGLALAVTSTVALTRSLENRGLLKSINGHIAVGWLVVQDLVVALVLVLLPALAGWLTGGADADVADRDLPLAVAITLGEVLVFVLLMIVVGKRVFPWVLWHVARTGSRELFTLCVIAAAVGIAYGAAAIFDVSFALGAFISGMVLRESALSHRAANESLPLRDAFAVLFFVSVGMLFDPAMLIREPARVLIVIAIIMLGNFLTTFLLALAFRYPLNTALTLATGLAQIGEFSFILATLGKDLGVLSNSAVNTIVAAAIVSITLNPLLYRFIDPLERWAMQHPRL